MAKRKKIVNANDSSSERSSYIIITLIIVILIYTVVLLGSQYFHSDDKSEDTSTSKYDQILVKAKELLRKYKNLSSSSFVNENLNNLHVPAAQTIDQLTQSRDKAFIANPQENKIKITNSNNLKDIIIGMAQDTDPKNLAVFCGSIRKVSQAIEVVIFVNVPIPKQHAAIATKYNILLIEFDLSTLDANLQKYHPSTLRWPLIYNYFKEESKSSRKYNRIWMIDVRDSFFQSDPFAMLPAGAATDSQSGFYVFGGVESVTIAECGWNGGWIKDCFGEKMLQQVGHSNIICSGVSVGTMDTVLPYLKLMSDAILGKDPVAKFPVCERNGVDQGLHNVLVHTHRIDHLKIWKQRDSPVINLQAKIARVDGATVYNLKGDKVAVVHQYDRNPALQKLLFKEYVYWVDTDSFLSEWEQDKSCQLYEYKQNKDLFKGACDIRTKGASSPASCCSICQTVDKCVAFTYFSGLCYLKSCRRPVGDTSLNEAISAYLK